MKQPFAERVKAGMERSGLALRELCRRSQVDPSLLSKVLSGKRPPPADEKALRRLAEALGLPAEELIVAAGVIPSEWSRLNDDPALLKSVSEAIASGKLPDAPRFRSLPPGGGGSRWGGNYGRTPHPSLPPSQGGKGHGLQDELL